MQYRYDKYGNELSVLGYGCMRFTKSAAGIDIDKTEKEIMAAYEAGVNYYDTAYIYPGSEAALGEILERNHIRDKVSIATKMPHYMLKKPENMDKIFDEELRRLRTDHVDYYLIHMLTDIKAWERVKALGIVEWLEKKKASGAIRQVGFSYHGNSDMFKKLIDAYDWEFCQIQYNYMDVNSQAGVTGLKYAAEKHIPVVIMEPLRGGKLVNGLPKEAVSRMENYPVTRTPAEWAFRWLWNQPEVTVVLSGMNSLQMVEENAQAASDALPGMLTADDLQFLENVAKDINAKMKVGCTGCRYCMPCPHGVDIPGTFSAYNRVYSESLASGLKEYMMCTILRKNQTVLTNCVQCGACETHCPQHIEIRKELKNAGKVLENPIMKVIKKTAPLVIKY